MDYKKTLKRRMYVSVAIAVFGALLIAATFIFSGMKSFFSGWGLGLFICGIAGVRKYFYITRDEETMRKREVAEKDERNMMLVNKARSFTFLLYAAGMSIAIVIFECIGKAEVATALAMSLCGLLFLYIIIYNIFQRKY